MNFKYILFYLQTEHCNGDKGRTSKTYKRVQRAVMTKDEVNVVNILFKPTLNNFKINPQSSQIIVS